MFGVYPFGVPYFADALFEVVPNLPPVTSTTFPRPECPVFACNNPADISLYSLQDALIFNTTPLSFVVQCPTGFTCPPGIYPRVVTYPPGTFVIPDPPVNPGFPTIISLQGCQTLVSRVAPAGATQDQINALGQEVILECASQQAICDTITTFPPTPGPTFLNQVVYYSFVCEEGSLITFDGSLPTWISIDTANSRLVGAAGVFAGASQVAANSAAQTALNNFGDNAIANDDLTCEAACLIDNSSPLPGATVGVVYSDTITASIITGTLTWSVSSGTLPDGLSLNSSTGEISGTPTTEEVSNFRISVTNGDVGCDKDFQITVGSDCPDWSTLLWGTPSITADVNADVTITPDSLPSASFSISALLIAFSNAFNASNTGTLDYNGSGCNCAVNVNLTNPAFVGFNNTSTQIGVFVDFVLVASHEYGPEPTGLYTIPFTLPDTSGVPVNVTISLFASNVGASEDHDMIMLCELVNV